MEDHAYIARLAGRQTPDIDDARAVHKMIRDGDLQHINGSFCTALASLADTGRAEFAGCEIMRMNGDVFAMHRDGYAKTAEGALEALIEAQEEDKRISMRAHFALDGRGPGWVEAA